MFFSLVRISELCSCIEMEVQAVKNEEKSSSILVMPDNSLIIVDFTNGKLKFSKQNHMKYATYRSTERHFNRQKRILVADSGRLLYTGCNYESKMSTITSSVLKVGILNKRSGQLKLYDVDFFRVKPLLKCKLSKMEVEEKTWNERSDDLSLAFGSKNKKNLVNSRMRQGATSVKSIDSLLQLNVDESYLKTKEQVHEEPASVIPPQNANASNVDDIYNIYDIISREEYCALDSVADVFCAPSSMNIQEWKSENKYCSLITHILEINILHMSVHKAKLLCYLHYLICFLKPSYKDWKKKDPVPQVPEPFKRKMMDIFVVSRSMPPRMKDKLLARAMVLALMLNNYHINAYIFASSTKIPMNRIVSIAHALGCYVSEKKGDEVKLIQLKLPLYKIQSGKMFKR